MQKPEIVPTFRRSVPAQAEITAAKGSARRAAAHGSNAAGLAISGIFPNCSPGAATRGFRPRRAEGELPRRVTGERDPGTAIPRGKGGDTPSQSRLADFSNRRGRPQKRSPRHGRGLQAERYSWVTRRPRFRSSATMPSSPTICPAPTTKKYWCGLSRNSSTRWAMRRFLSVKNCV